MFGSRYALGKLAGIGGKSQSEEENDFDPHLPRGLQFGLTWDIGQVKCFLFHFFPPQSLFIVSSELYIYSTAGMCLLLLSSCRLRFRYHTFISLLANRRHAFVLLISGTQ